MAKVPPLLHYFASRRLLNLARPSVITKSWHVVSATPSTISFDLLFKTLQMFCSWSENVHAILTLRSSFSLFFFSTCELSHSCGISYAFSGYFLSTTLPTFFRFFLNFAYALFIDRNAHYRQIIFFSCFFFNL